MREEMEWAIHHGDCIEHMAAMEPESVHLAVMSVPFPSVYSYTSSPRDIGNSEDLRGEAKIHFSYFMRALLRVMMPGRVAMIHCMDIVRMKRSGGSGIFDFRGMLIRLGERAGFIHDYTWACRRNPQSQAIRTRSRSLQFAGLETDRAQSRGALPDYLIKFIKPGVNPKKIDGDEQVSRNDWIKLAEYCWDDIRETNTLNVEEGRGEDDTRHICPMQLDMIERCVKLFSDPGEIVFDPFSGIGSTAYTALMLGRRAYGVELKTEYYHAAVRNCERAVERRKAEQRSLLDLCGS